MKPREYHITLYFDSGCRFCNRIVRFVHKHSQQHIILMRPLAAMGPVTSDYVNHINERITPDSIIVVRGRDVFFRSEAVFEVVRRLKRPWSWLWILHMLPQKFTDFLYKIIARNRKRWFGGEDRC